MLPVRSKLCAWGTAIAAGMALIGCACEPVAPPPESYVVLLPNLDNKGIGQVSVKSGRGIQNLSRAREGAFLNGASEPFIVSEEKIARDFGASMAARALPPEQFNLYFERGGTELTADAKALLPRILERARARQGLDISVIGHTDTQGSGESNYALALRRATTIAQQLVRQGLPERALRVESHGEANPLVPTPDETAEPLNRRVEVTLR